MSKMFNRCIRPIVNSFFVYLFIFIHFIRRVISCFFDIFGWRKIWFKFSLMHRSNISNYNFLLLSISEKKTRFILITLCVVGFLLSTSACLIALYLWVRPLIFSRDCACVCRFYLSHFLFVFMLLWQLQLLQIELYALCDLSWISYNESH